MAWHPPIPFGALYVEDALQLGPALSLLGYCYDKVGRDGRVQLNLRTAAGEIGVPYPTLRRWWDMLRRSCFIASHKERGRAGIDVQMSAEWLDWHYEKEVETGSEMIPNKEKRAENGIRNDPLSQETGRKRAENGIRNDPDRSMYKVLMDSDQAESVRGMVNDREVRDGTARTLTHPALQVLAEYYPSATLDAKQVRSICSTATDGKVWRSVVELFAQNGWQPLVGNLLDRYRKALNDPSTRPNEAPPRTTAAPKPERPADARSAQESAARLIAQIRQKA